MIKNAIHLCAAVTSAVMLSVLGGCVERKIVIGSDPSGALVTLNGVEVGRTPVTVPFIWYGDYDIVLRHEKNVGTPEKPEVKRFYLHTHKKTVTPWFETLGVDLFAELWPGELKDEQVWAFAVPEVEQVPDAELIERARQMKEQLEGPRAK